MELGLVPLVGRAMLSKTLVHLSADGWGCVPTLLFIWPEATQGENTTISRASATSWECAGLGDTKVWLLMAGKSTNEQHGAGSCGRKATRRTVAKVTREKDLRKKASTAT